MSYEHNLFISQGTDFTANVVFYTSNTSGRYPVDTSNYTSGRCHMRKCVGSTSYTDLAVTFPAKNIEQVVRGTITLHRSITR